MFLQNQEWDPSTAKVPFSQYAKAVFKNFLKKILKKCPKKFLKKEFFAPESGPRTIDTAVKLSGLIMFGHTV